jgi:hypothetical protein
MINFIETLIGVAIVAGIAALIMYFRRRAIAARRLGIIAAVSAITAAALEIYVRWIVYKLP